MYFGEASGIKKKNCFKINAIVLCYIVFHVAVDDVSDRIGLAGEPSTLERRRCIE